MTKLDRPIGTVKKPSTRRQILEELANIYLQARANVHIEHSTRERTAIEKVIRDSEEYRNLEKYLQLYCEATGMREGKDFSIFPSMIGDTCRFKKSPLGLKVKNISRKDDTADRLAEMQNEHEAMIQKISLEENLTVEDALKLVEDFRTKWLKKENTDAR